MAMRRKWALNSDQICSQRLGRDRLRTTGYRGLLASPGRQRVRSEMQPSHPITAASLLVRRGVSTALRKRASYPQAGGPTTLVRLRTAIVEMERRTDR